MIDAKGLKKHYGQTIGIDGVDLKVDPHQIFGFVGPNGSGKTTFIRILLGLIKHDEGSVQVLGNDVSVGQYAFNQDIGYMPSESFFFSDLRCKEIIDFFRETREVDSNYLDHLVSYLDIDLNKKFKSLSFGNKKKIGIVVAMMHQPKLLILDEPTSGLDPLIQKRFLELISEQNRKGATIFLSSHVLSEIEKVCDRVALIKDGKILLLNTIDEIKKDEHKRLLVQPKNEKLVLPGLSFQKDLETHSQYAYQGNINLLIDYLSTFKFDDVILRDVGLEEIFSIYYEKEDKS